MRCLIALPHFLRRKALPVAGHQDEDSLLFAPTQERTQI